MYRCKHLELIKKKLLHILNEDRFTSGDVTLHFPFPVDSLAVLHTYLTNLHVAVYIMPTTIILKTLHSSWIVQMSALTSSSLTNPRRKVFTVDLKISADSITNQLCLRIKVVVVWGGGTRARSDSSELLWKTTEETRKNKLQQNVNYSCCWADQCGCCFSGGFIRTGWRFHMKRRTLKKTIRKDFLCGQHRFALLQTDFGFCTAASRRALKRG